MNRGAIFTNNPAGGGHDRWMERAGVKKREPLAECGHDPVHVVDQQPLSLDFGNAAAFCAVDQAAIADSPIPKMVLIGMRYEAFVPLELFQK